MEALSALLVLWTGIHQRAVTRSFDVKSTAWNFHYCDVIMSPMASQITSLAIVYSIAYSGTDQRKHQSSASLAFVRGIHRGPGNSPHKWPVTRKMFPFDDVIMCILIQVQLRAINHDLNQTFIMTSTSPSSITGGNMVGILYDDRWLYSSVGSTHLEFCCSMHTVSSNKFSIESVSIGTRQEDMGMV